ncbi:oxidoreductase [Patulibacter minatonensis]|uniref:oxidoreductase n=1 Tax=Patulibacter minatonensis TaxID=298163 RepID=UPI00047A8DAA|nr:oxidoreductase [Patulibacter minatonensis]
MSWSTSDIPQLDGRRAVVTGANGGLGLQTAQELARRGAHVTLAVRDVSKGAKAVDRISKEVPGASLAVETLDLSKLASVRAFAAREISGGAPLDLLVNNAGIMATPPRVTEDGFELQFGTNHLGHFALTGLLLPLLQAADAPRVVTVSSVMHKVGTIDFDDLNWQRSYGPWRAYGRSKLSNLLFARELQARADAAGVPLRSLSSHPGYSSTHLQTSGPGMSGGILGRLNAWGGRVGNALIATKDSYGAQPSLYAATHPEVPGGAFVGPTRLMQTRGPIGPVPSNASGRDMAVASRLFDVSEELTGVSFDLQPAAG